MITNLFSSFDPSSFFGMPLNWISLGILLLILSPNFWAYKNKINIIFNSLLRKLFLEFKILTASRHAGRTIIFLSLFFLILYNNVLGLLPYIFTASRHLTLTLTLRLPIWLRFIAYGWFNNINHIFAHIVPQRTPTLLIPFIVLIERVRNVIRPLTLSVRLIANIVAGHLLITLLGNQTASSSNLILVTLLLTQVALLTLEVAVAFIQSYVFAILSTLYSRETRSH